MVAYTLPFVLMIMLRLALHDRPNSRRLMFFFLAGALFVFTGFRFEVGCDWTGYVHHWHVADMTSIWSRLEPFWWGLIKALHLVSSSYLSLNVAAAAIFFAGLYMMARRQPDPLGFLILQFPVLMLNMPMSAIRQAAAIGVIYVAFNAFSDRKTALYVALIILAAGLHNSAVVLLALAPFVGADYSRNRLILSIILALPGIAVLMGSSAAQLATTRYIEGDIGASGAVFRVGLLLLTGVFFQLMLRKHWRQDYPADFKLAMIGSMIMIACFLLVPVSSVIADRIAYLVIPVQAMILARLPYFTGLRNRSLYMLAWYLLLLFVLVFWTSQSGLFKQCYTPYQSWIFGVPLGVVPSF